MITLFLAALHYLNTSGRIDKSNMYIAVIIMQIIIFIIPGIIYCKLRGSGFIPKLRLNLFSANKLWLTALAFFVLVSGSALIKIALYTLGYYSTQYTMYEQYVPAAISGFGDLVYIIIAVAILPAITEEFIFRGVILGEYSDMGCTNTVAILISSLLFSLVHLNIYQLPVFFFGGIILAFITLTTNSLFCAITVHLLNNTFSLLFESQLLNLISQTDSIIFVLFIIASVFLIFLILAFQAVERIYYKKGINGEPSPEKLKLRKRKKNSSGKFDINTEAIVSPALILCVIAFIIITILLK